MKKVGVAGTFNVLHKGHKALLQRAFQLGDRIVVGIAADDMTAGKRYRVPLERRLAGLREYLAQRDKDWEIEILSDWRGSAAWDEDLVALVVSESTVDNARKINEERVSKGLRELEIETTRHVLGEDCTTITSSRILEGEIDEEGRLLRPLRVGIGSENEVKVEAVRDVMGRVYDRVELFQTRVATTVGSQPWNEKILQGAEERARDSLGKNDYGVGIEAGIVVVGGDLFGTQICAIIDKEGRVTRGQSSSFMYPPEADVSIRRGTAVSEVFEDLYGVEDVGRREGAVGFLSKGALDRKGLSEQAILAAMIPRISKEIYFMR